MRREPALPGAPPWRTTSPSVYREGRQSRRSFHSLHRLYFGYFWVGSSLQVLGEVYCFGPSMSGLGFCLILGVVWGPRGGQPHGTGWVVDGLSIILLWGGCLVCVLHSSLHKPKSLHLVSTVWTVPVLARGISGWRSPGPSHGKAETLFCFLRNLSRAEPSAGRRVVFRRGAAYVLLPGQGPKPYVKAVEKQPSPSPWAKGNLLGGHHQPPPGLQAMLQVPEETKIPGPGASLVFPRGGAPAKSEGRE